MFKEIIYKVLRINGDYAELIDSDGCQNTVAMALLPIEIDEGMTVLYKNLEYIIVEG